jgi:hypothetical protein
VYTTNEGLSGLESGLYSTACKMAETTPTNNENKNVLDLNTIAAEQTALIISGSVYTSCYIQHVINEALTAQQTIYDSYKRREIELELVRKKAWVKLLRKIDRQRIRRLSQIRQLEKERQQLEQQNCQEEMELLQYIQAIRNERYRLLQHVYDISVFAKKRKKEEDVWKK